MYERLIQNPSLLSTKQKLLVPEAVSADPSLVANLRGLKSAIEQVGFSLRYISDTTVEILEAPTMLGGRDLGKVVLTLGESIDPTALSDKRLEALAPITSTIACHSAVRAGESLTKDQVIALLAEARGIDFYHNCPHGRRVFKWFSQREVERWFDR